MEKSRSFTSRPAEDRSCRMMLAWHFWFGEVGSGKKPTWPPLAQGHTDAVGSALYTKPGQRGGRLGSSAADVTK